MNQTRSEKPGAALKAEPAHLAERAGRSAGSLPTIAGKRETAIWLGGAAEQGFGLPRGWRGAWRSVSQWTGAHSDQSGGRLAKRASRPPPADQVGHRPQRQRHPSRHSIRSQVAGVPDAGHHRRSDHRDSPPAIAIPAAEPPPVQLGADARDANAATYLPTGPGASRGARPVGFPDPGRLEGTPQQRMARRPDLAKVSSCWAPPRWGRCWAQEESPTAYSSARDQPARSFTRCAAGLRLEGGALRPGAGRTDQKFKWRGPRVCSAIRPANPSRGVACRSCRGLMGVQKIEQEPGATRGSCGPALRCIRSWKNCPMRCDEYLTLLTGLNLTELPTAGRERQKARPWRFTAGRQPGLRRWAQAMPRPW